MSRTDLDAITLANMLRRKAGDGSIEWVMEPIQTSVLLDIADALDENEKLRKELNHWRVEQTHAYSNWQDAYERAKKCEDENAKLRELAKDACTVLRNHYNKEWFDGTVFAERMRKLGIEVGE